MSLSHHFSMHELRVAILFSSSKLIYLFPCAELGRFTTSISSMLKQPSLSPQRAPQKVFGDWTPFELSI